MRDIEMVCLQKVYRDYKQVEDRTMNTHDHKQGCCCSFDILNIQNRSIGFIFKIPLTSEQINTHIVIRLSCYSFKMHVESMIESMDYVSKLSTELALQCVIPKATASSSSSSIGRVVRLILLSVRNCKWLFLTRIKCVRLSIIN